VTFKPYSLKTKPRTIYAGRYNPYKQFLDHLRMKLIGLGFQEMKGPMVEQEFWNFDALYAPQDHASREDSDILLIKSPTHGVLSKRKYVKNVGLTHEDGWKTGSLGHRYRWDPRKAARLLLRPQGTSISARTLAQIEQPPAKFFSIARCFRPDQIDATHDIEFDQTEGIICNPDITFRDLLGMLRTFAVEVAGATEVRFRPDYYPFTSPSVELSAKHPVLGYIEFGGAGVFRPEVTQPFGIDYPVLAWGLGVGRLFMTKYHVKDIRELFTQNLDWLRTQEVSSGIQLEEE
jgi:phenylalanyl-tRNA synthetase alpha chain